MIMIEQGSNNAEHHSLGVDLGGKAPLTVRLILGDILKVIPNFDLSIVYIPPSF